MEYKKNTEGTNKPVQWLSIRTAGLSSVTGSLLQWPSQLHASKAALQRLKLKTAFGKNSVGDWS